MKLYFINIMVPVCPNLRVHSGHAIAISFGRLLLSHLDSLVSPDTVVGQVRTRGSDTGLGHRGSHVSPETQVMSGHIIPTGDQVITESRSYVSRHHRSCQDTLLRQGIS